MNKKLFFTGITSVVLCALLPLAGCGSSKGTTIPEANIQSGHNYEAGICTDCGYKASLWDGETAYNFESGKGTSEDPYVIATAEQFAFFANTTKNINFAGQYIRLDSNIDLNGLEWTPIGDGSNFAGNFDGAGHTVSAFKITAAASYTGLFGSVSGSIRNLKTENFFIGYNIDDNSFLMSSAMACCGGLVGAASNAEIVNCSVEDGQIFVTASMGFLYVGGCVGRISYATQVSNVYTNVNLFCEQYGDGSEMDCGGIVGISTGDRTGACISNSFSAGEAEMKTKGDNAFSTNSTAKLGGIVGHMKVGEISGCATNCDLTISGKTQKKYVYMGSIAARKDKDFVNCYSMDTQTFTKYSQSLDFYDLDYSGQITQMSGIGVKTQLQLLWDNDIWSFSGATPYLKLFTSY